MSLVVSPSVMPSGGAIVLNISCNSETITVTRNGSQIYSGNYVPILLDTNLSPSQNYSYVISDSNGNQETLPPITPTSSLVIDVLDISSILIQIFNSAMKSLTFPPGILKPKYVATAMPNAILNPAPFISIYENVVKQSQIPMGQQTTPITDSDNLLPIIVRRDFTIFSLHENPNERDYYRNMMIGIVNTSLNGLFAAMGQNITHDFVCESGQLAQDHKATSPGFYFNELLFTLTGPMNFGISNQYLPINKIVLVGSENNLPVIDVQAPP